MNLGDSGDFIRFTVHDYDDTVKDLTGWGGRVVAYSSPTGTTYMVSGALTLVSGTDGTCHYVISGADTDVGGIFPAHLILTSGVSQVSVAGWQFLVSPFVASPTITEYCTVEDIQSDENAYKLLRLEDYKSEDIRTKIRLHSAVIDKRIGQQSSDDEVIVQLCKYMVLADIASGLPAAQADGETRISLLGIVSKWENWIRETMSDYGWGSPTPVWISP